MSFIHATETFYALEEEAKRIPQVDSISEHTWIFDVDDLQELMSYYNEIELGFARLAEMGGPQGLASALRTNLTKGLSEDEILKNNEGIQEGIAYRKEIFGPNSITHPPGKTWWALAWDELGDVMLRVLIICGFISIIVGAIDHPDDGWFDGLAILIAVAIVVVVGATNNYKKEQQFRAMEIDSEKNECFVIRHGNEMQIDFEEVVVGDLISLKQGSSVPCDSLFVLGSENWKTNESALTGETRDIPKNRHKPFFMKGTECSSGQGYTLAIVVGDKTEYGQLMIKLRKPREDTPLQEKLEHLGEMIGYGGAAVAVSLFLILIIRWAAFDGADDPGPNIIEFFIIAITIIVVAVPEGLPLAVTISLAYSMRKMMSDNNFVRVLAACETMGNATTICSDKTGTLTQNLMSVVRCHLCMTEYFSNLPRKDELNEYVYDILTQNLTCSTEAIWKSDDQLTPQQLEGIKLGELKRPLTGGNSTGRAMLQWAIDLGSNFNALRREMPVTKAFPFDSAVKRSSVLCKSKTNDKEYHVYTKGASEQILKLCKYYLDNNGEIQELTSNYISNIEGAIKTMTVGGLRCLGVSFKIMNVNDILFSKNENGERTVKDEDSDNLFTDHIWITVCGIADPVRPEVPNAVLTCQQAGIVVRMVTGDHLDTAKHIAKECHILSAPEHVCMTGSEYRMLTEEEKKKKLPYLRVLARSKPSDKESLVRWYMKENNDVVAVTGDGANDALALSEANVGLSMGRTGTDIAKKASDIVITDDNFASIVKTVMWGRSIYDNIRKFVQFQLTINFVALTLSLIGAFFSEYQNPLTAVQLLWVNLIMDTMAALALATEPPSMDLLKRNPYVRDGSLVSKLIWRFVIGHGTYQLTALLITMFAGESIFDIRDQRGKHGEDGDRNPVLLSIIFNQFVWMQIFNEVNARRVQNEHNVIGGIHKNPFFGAILVITIVLQVLIVEFARDFADTIPLNGKMWGYCIAWGAGEMIIGQIVTIIPVDMEDGVLQINKDQLFRQDPDTCGEFLVKEVGFDDVIGFYNMADDPRQLDKVRVQKSTSNETATPN